MGSKECNIAEWSSSVARRAHNPKVVGSNPSSATKIALEVQCFQGFLFFGIGINPQFVDYLWNEACFLRAAPISSEVKI